MLSLFDLGCDPMNKISHPSIVPLMNEYNILFDEKDEARSTLEHARKIGETPGVLQSLERTLTYRQVLQDKQEQRVINKALELDHA